MWESFKWVNEVSQNDAGNVQLNDVLNQLQDYVHELISWGFALGIIKMFIIGFALIVAIRFMWTATEALKVWMDKQDMCEDCDLYEEWKEGKGL